MILVWTANTERFSSIIPTINDTASNLLSSISSSHEEISPSTLFAVASIMEGCPFINGSPQNTFVPGLLELAEQKKVFVGGDDFKSGQTKFKSVIVDFLVGAGIKPTSIVSYNHLGKISSFFELDLLNIPQKQEIMTEKTSLHRFNSDPKKSQNQTLSTTQSPPTPSSTRKTSTQIT